MGRCMLGRAGVMPVEESLHFKRINSSSGFGGVCLSHQLSVSLVETFTHVMSLIVTPRRWCCFLVGLAITDMPGRVKHSSFCLSLTETPLNGIAGSCKGIDRKAF